MNEYISPSTIWWSYVAGPSRLIAKTVKALLEGTSVCVFDDNTIPHHDAFFRLVADSVRKTKDMVLDDNVESAHDPGMYLIEHYNRSPDYRGNITPAKFLLKHNVLAGRLLSVSMQSLESRNWLDFIKSYSSDSIDKGLFLMIAEKTQGLNTSKNMLTLNYSEFVTEYDALVFAGLFGTDAKQSIKEKRYIAALAVSLFGKDAVQSYQIDKEPAEYIMDGLLSDEIIRRRVWEAQILELFPLVVQRTRELIDIWRTQFNDAFDYIDSSRDYPNNKFPNGLTNAYKEPINSPDELEIGTIKFLMGQRRLDSNGNISTDYVLYFYDERTRLCVELLYYLRNRLAHGRVCPAADAERLLRLEVH